MKGEKIIFLTVFIVIFMGFALVVPVSALAAGPAFTGLAAKADTAETVFLNPAGMSRLEESGWFINPQVMYTENSTEFTVGGQTSTQEIKSDETLFLPVLFYARPLGERWSFGIGPTLTSGLGSSYNNTWPGRYLVTEWSQLFVGIIPSVAYRVSDELSIGFSLSINYSRFTLEKAVFNGPGQADGKFELEADGIGVGGNLGLLYEFNARTRLGVVYRSEVTAEDEGTPELSGVSNARRTLLEQEISMDSNSPQSLLAGLFHDFDNGWTISADALWLDFSEWNLDNITIGNTTIAKQGTDYQDIWAFTLGTTYDLLPAWTLRGGVLYATSGIEDEDRTAFLRIDAFWAIGGGIEYKFSNKRSIAVDITYFQFGDGEFTAANVPIVGSISGEYDTNFGVLLGVSLTL